MMLAMQFWIANAIKSIQTHKYIEFFLNFYRKAKRIYEWKRENLRMSYSLWATTTNVQERRFFSVLLILDVIFSNFPKYDQRDLCGFQAEFLLFFQVLRWVVERLYLSHVEPMNWNMSRKFSIFLIRQRRKNTNKFNLYLHNANTSHE